MDVVERGLKTDDGGTRLARCAWPKSPLDIAYHDAEWGVPVHDDQVLFELLTLEGAQAGLSWSTILKKGEAYRRAFDGFAPARVEAPRGSPRVPGPGPQSSLVLSYPQPRR